MASAADGTHTTSPASQADKFPSSSVWGTATSSIAAPTSNSAFTITSTFASTVAGPTSVGTADQDVIDLASSPSSPKSDISKFIKDVYNADIPTQVKLKLFQTMAVNEGNQKGNKSSKIKRTVNNKAQCGICGNFFSQLFREDVYACLQK